MLLINTEPIINIHDIIRQHCKIIIMFCILYIVLYLQEVGKISTHKLSPAEQKFVIIKKKTPNSQHLVDRTPKPSKLSVGQRTNQTNITIFGRRERETSEVPGYPRLERETGPVSGYPWLPVGLDWTHHKHIATEITDDTPSARVEQIYLE